VAVMDIAIQEVQVMDLLILEVEEAVEVIAVHMLIIVLLLDMVVLVLL
jgi:hypothetical protein